MGNAPILPRTIRGRIRNTNDKAALDASEIRKHMDRYGIDTEAMIERGRKRGRSMERRRARQVSDDDESDSEMMDVDGISKGHLKRQKKEKKEARKREQSLARSHSRPREPSQVGLKDEAAERIASKLDKRGRKNWEGLSG